MPQLYVNLDHVATIREARGTSYPSPVDAAALAESSGLVQGITLHLREDRRHVSDADVRAVAAGLRIPFNFEMSIAEDIVARCLEVTPAQATLVPERREEVTTEGGLDLIAGAERLRAVCRRLQDAGIAVSLFIDPDVDMVRRSVDTGATHVELHTGRYADATSDVERKRELAELQAAAHLAQELGLVVNAGHGLTVENVGPVAAIRGMNDLNIGHAIIGRSIFLGLEGALREMVEAIAAAAPGPRQADAP